MSIQLRLGIVRMISVGVVIAALFMGCQQKGEKGGDQAGGDQMKAVVKAVAHLSPTENSQVQGTVVFTQTDGGVRVEATVEGLAPGEHGFHIHEFGDCSAPDGTSAGGHFNPEGVEHGAPDAAVRHVGDLGNLTADENGKARYDRVDSLLSFTGAHNIIGRGVIIHAAADDLTSQPTGAAGARLACGVIEAAQE